MPRNRTRGDDVMRMRTTWCWSACWRAIERIGAASPDTLDYMKKLLTNSGGG
jgi:hypothetical protein